MQKGTCVAKEIGLIKTTTYQEGLAAKDFRNLIHPGRSRRKQMIFTRATALTVRAALEHVIEDLEREA